MEHNIEALGDMCEKTIGVVEQIIQQTRQLNVANIDVDTCNVDDDGKAMMS